MPEFNLPEFNLIIECDYKLTNEDKAEIIADCVTKYPHALGARVMVIDDYLGYKPIINPVPFDRIRRVTGYLVGTLDRWNDGKRAEEADRVKHSCSNGCDMCEGE